MRASGMVLPNWMSTLPKPTRKTIRTTPKRKPINKYTKKKNHSLKKKEEKEKEQEE